MRVADIFMSFPSIVLILVLVAVIGPSIWSVTIVIGVLGWTVCQTDLCQCAFRLGKGICGVCEGDRYFQL